MSGACGGKMLEIMWLRGKARGCATGGGARWAAPARGLVGRLR